jgi:hypothetical protein
VTAGESAELRVGERVVVRGRAEILATLDENGRLRSLPFMPEMLAFAGRELRVQARAHKTCDTINMTGTNRALDNTVHLVGARCDGSAHGGCQAGCLLFFREEWLQRPDGTPVLPSPAPVSDTRSGSAASSDIRSSEAGGSGTVTTLPAPPQVAVATEETLTRDTEAEPGEDGKPRYRCQATELLRASRPLSPAAPRQYLEDVSSGNVGRLALLVGLLVAIFNKYQGVSRRLPSWLRIKGGRPYPFILGTGPTDLPPLGLQPGELVEVKSKDEIIATLGPNNRLRNLWFDAEMLPYCGSKARVLRRVDRILDEGTGRMMKLRDCVVLDGAACQGRYNRFCPRAIEVYWREAWLRRVPE